jgi:hypothetical protein
VDLIGAADTRYNEQFRPEFSRLHQDRDLRWVVPFSVRYVVAVSGERFAGKSAALAFLSEKKGFELYSLATILREEAVRLGIPLEPRARLQDLGDELRAHFRDPAYLARMTLRRIHRDHLAQRGTIEPLRRVAVGGFKRPEEIKLFESLGRFRHLRIEAEIKNRIKFAKRSGIALYELQQIDRTLKLNKKNFVDHIDGRDREGDENLWRTGYGQAVATLMEIPDAEPVPNNDDLAELHRRLDEKIKQLDHSFRAFSA